MRLFSYIIFIFLVQLTFGQTPVGDNKSNTAFELFQEEQYENVVRDFGKRIDLSIDEIFILNLSHLKIGENTSNRLEQTIKNNPDHALSSLSQFYLGEYFFYNGDSVKSRYYIAKTKPLSLSKKNQASYGFIAGIQSLESKNFIKAKKLFSQSLKLNFSDKSKLNYYLAFTNYHLGNQEDALNGFESNLSNEQYASSSRFFIAKINLDLGKYEEVIALAQSELSDEVSITNSGFYQLIGEAYAKKNSAAKADAYFDKAIQLHPGKPSSALYYQAGVSKFKIGNDIKAIKYLTEAGIGAGEYAQLSAFQLGRLYLQQKEFDKALTAYTEASSSKEASIKEESLYQVAKLHAQLGEFTEALNYSDDYLKSFKNGQWVIEIQNLIAETYLRTSNYDLAIDHLEKLGIVGQTQQAVYQKVSFQKAQLLFNDALFDESIEWFRKSMKYPIDAVLKNESLFQVGESYMAQEQYKKAIQSYSMQLKPSPMTFYGIGYAYYNLEEYGRAIESFRRFITIAPNDMKVDGQIRLADCLYATKNYTESLGLYTSLRRDSQSSYVRYQVGLVQKELGAYDQAISSFRKVENDSPWKDDAIFNIASLQFEKTNFEEAEKGYSRLIDESSSSNILSKSLLNRAICYSNLDQLLQAKNDYERILDNHLTSKQAFSAILGLQELKQKGVSINNLDKKIASYKAANPYDNSLESVEFEAAKASYFDLNYSQAIQSLGGFIKEYPKSSFIPEAKYYTGDSYYRIGELNESLEVFNELRTYRNNFTGRVFTRIGEMNYQLRNYDRALEAYNQLLILALSPKDSYNAKLGMMKAYFDKANYPKTVELADDILIADWKPLNAEPIAILYKARSLKGINDIDLAISDFEKLVNGNDVIAAEANYQLALIDFERGENASSIEKLFELNGKFGSYAQWVDKSYLLIADNYLATNELFQAKATLRSIIEHSKNQEVTDIAKKKLASIEQQSTSVDTSNVNNN